MKNTFPFLLPLPSTMSVLGLSNTSAPDQCPPHSLSRLEELTTWVFALTITNLVLILWVIFIQRVQRREHDKSDETYSECLRQQGSDIRQLLDILGELEINIQQKVNPSSLNEF